MTKFETIGVQRQINSKNIEEANYNFEISCLLCCSRGMHIECDKCAIRGAFLQNCACFNAPIPEDA